MFLWSCFRSGVLVVLMFALGCQWWTFGGYGGPVFGGVGGDGGLVVVVFG